MASPRDAIRADINAAYTGKANQLLEAQAVRQNDLFIEATR